MINPDGKKLVVPMGNDHRRNPGYPQNDQVAIVDISQDVARLIKEVPVADEPDGWGIAFSAASCSMQAPSECRS